MLNRSEVNDGMEEVTFTRREGEQTIRFPGHVSEREREGERSTYFGENGPRVRASRVSGLAFEPRINTVSSRRRGEKLRFRVRERERVIHETRNRYRFVSFFFSISSLSRGFFNRDEKKQRCLLIKVIEGCK